MQDNESPNTGWRLYGIASGFVGEVVVLVLAAIIGGSKADEAFDSSPWLLLVSLIVAVFVIILLIWRLRRWF